MRTLLPLLFLAACADSADDRNDAAADAAPQQATDGKADGVDYTGLYHISSSTWHSNDVTDLQLLDSGSYVRARCYHASCAEWLPETDKYDVYTSSSGYTYVRFWTVKIDANLNSTPVIADVYQIKKISKGVSLRKAHTTRWFSLFKEVASAACANSGGTWSDTCTCPGDVPNQPAATIFIAGAGGCITTPGSDESNCDSSGGMWTDDESTLIGTYCICGQGRYDDSTGNCSAI